MAQNPDIGVIIGIQGLNQYFSDLNKVKGQTASQMSAGTKSVTGLGRSFKNTASQVPGLGSAIRFLTNPLTLAVVGITAFTKAADKQIQAEAQLAQRIKSTGGAAGLSAKELKKLASELQGISTFGDEAIIEAEALLLTFTKVGKKTFPDATKTILDMSTAMKQDLKASTVLVGKALNDPIKGLSALTRVGVVFTDEQKKQIKVMQEAGDTAGAQAVILKELQTEFGGAAEAASQAGLGPLKQLQNIMGDVGEEIGKIFIPIIRDVANVLKTVFEFIIENKDFMIPVVKGLLAGVVAFKAISLATRLFSAALAANPIGLALTGVAALAAGVAALASQFGGVSEEQKKFNRIQSEVTSQLAKERVESDKLFKQLKDENVPRAEKSKLINQLKSQYGQYLGDLNTEEEILGNIEKVQKRVNDGLRSKIILDIKSAEKNAVLEKQATSLLGSVEELTKKTGISASEIERLIKKFSEEGGSISNVFTQSSAAVNEFKNLAAGVDNEYTKMLGNLNDGANGATNELVRQFAVAALGFDKFTGELERQDKFINDLFGGKEFGAIPPGGSDPGGLGSANKEIQAATGSLNFFSAELSKLQKEFENVKIGTDRWIELNDEIAKTGKLIEIAEERARILREGLGAVESIPVNAELVDQDAVNQASLPLPQDFSLISEGVEDAISPFERLIAKMDEVGVNVGELMDTFSMAWDNIKTAGVNALGELASGLAKAAVLGTSASDVFKKVLIGLGETVLVQVPKFLGLYLLETAVGLGFPVGIPFALAGLGLLAFSGAAAGLLSKVGGKQETGLEVPELTPPSINGPGGLSGFTSNNFESPQLNVDNISVNIGGREFDDAVVDSIDRNDELSGN